jgi:hypothetical protein
MDRDEEQLADDGGMEDDAHLEDQVDETGADDGADEAADEGRAEIEARAREQGWKPQSDWKGDRSNWVDADKYLDRLKPAKLREAHDRTARELAELKRERAAERRDFEDRLARLDKMGQKALARQREQLLSQTKAAQRAAAEAGDMEAFDHWQTREAELTEDLAKEAAELAPTQPRQKREAGEPDPTVKAWADANPAVVYDPVKWNAAVAFFSEAERELPDGTIADHLAHVEERLAQTWPGVVKRRGKPQNGRANGQQQDDDRRGQRAPQTESSGRIASRGARAKGWAEIPAEEKKIYKEYIADGLFKDEADAAKAHWS